MTHSSGPNGTGQLLYYRVPAVQAYHTYICTVGNFATKQITTAVQPAKVVLEH